MERNVSVEEAFEIFKVDFIGANQLLDISDKIDIQIGDVPEIPFGKEFLISKAREGYILFLGGAFISSNKKITLLSLRDQFGVNPEISEPCFYNQDWYLNENFVNSPIECKWYLLKKNLAKESRSISPESLKSTFCFPPAIVCAYIFFVYWFHAKKCLWEHDFVWCKELDSNGDPVYVGKYNDINGINKNGFSIHRHLKLRNIYGSIDFVG